MPEDTYDWRKCCDEIIQMLTTVLACQEETLAKMRLDALGGSTNERDA